MAKYIKWLVLLFILLSSRVSGAEQFDLIRNNATDESREILAQATDYTVGPGDILSINILEPDKMITSATVSPDGVVTAPYIGQVNVLNLSIAQIQEEIAKRLTDGYMKFPSVMVSLVESNSRKFFVYGAVVRPGSYRLEDSHMTILRGISVAGGFTRFGSSSRVKLLRAKKGGAGYESIKINIAAVMAGDPKADQVLANGDIIVVSEGLF